MKLIYKIKNKGEIRMKIIKKMFMVMFLLFMVVGTSHKALASGLSINESKLQLGKKQSYTLEIAGTSSIIEWASSNTKVATVKNGTVKAKNTGKTTITAIVDGQTLKCKVTVSKVYLKKTSLTLTKKKTYTLSLKGTDAKVKWKSTNKKVITVNSQGKVTAKGAGTAYITAKSGGKTYKCKITVEAPSISKSKVTINKGIEYQLTINNTSKKISWKSSNTKIATVNKNGIVTPKKKGSATITATVDGIKFTCKVNVTDEPTLSSTNIVLDENTNMITLSANNADDVQWSISNDILSYTQHGNKNTITLYKNWFGVCTVTAKIGTKQLYCTVKSYVNITKQNQISEGASGSTLISYGNEQIPTNCVSSDSSIVKVNDDNTYTALNTGVATLTYTCGEYYKRIESITVTGTYIEKQGTYDETLTRKVYEALADSTTRRTDLSIDNTNYMSEEQLSFLLATADKWYKGEITIKQLKYLMQYTAFPINESYRAFIKGRYYFLDTNSPQTFIIKGHDSSTIIESMNKEILGTSYGTGASWAKNLLYIKINYDNTTDTSYVYLIP